MLKTEQTLRSATMNVANTAVNERLFSAARRLKTWLCSTMKQEKSREQTNFAFLANEFVGCNDKRKINFNFNHDLIESYMS